MAEKRRSVVGLLVAASLLWGAARLTWVRVSTADDLRGQRIVDVAGGTWATELGPLALTVLAAVAAVLAVRGVALRAVAVVVALVGVLAAVAPVRLLVSGVDRDRAAQLLDPPATALQVSTSVSAPGPLLALLGAVLVVVAGLYALRTPRRAGGLSDRYQTPAVRREQAGAADGGTADPDTDLAERRLWDALDAGLDPTTDDAPADAPARDARHRGATLSEQQARDRGEGGRADHERP